MSFRQAIAKLSHRLQNSAAFLSSTTYSSARVKVSQALEAGDYRQGKHHSKAIQWAFISGQAAILLGIHSSVSLAESNNNDTSVPGIIGLQKVEDGSVISNEHTSKWRIFTDNGRDFFLKGNIPQAEKFFVSALQEAKEGFGERDPHVASACNNLAELYRIKSAYDDAEPLYVEAIKILEDYFGTNDVRVGAALHNLGQFYYVQRKLEKARACYERALKIKRRVLGEVHPEYADTMYHLGTVLHLQGDEGSADLIQDSIQILEAAGQGESITCIRRMQYLAQIYTKSNRFTEAEVLLRKVLHVVELSKGWKSLDTVLATERLALTIQKAGKLKESEELLETCLEIRKSLLPDVHIQNASNMIYIARVKIEISNQLMGTDRSQAMAELDLAKTLLRHSIRVGRQVLDQSHKQKGAGQPIGVRGRIGKERHSTALILLQAMNFFGSLERTKLQNSKEYDITEAEAVLSQCISTFKEFEKDKSISGSPEIKAEYLSCLRCFHEVISKGRAKDSAGVIKDIEDEIRRVEVGISKS